MTGSPNSPLSMLEFLNADDTITDSPPPGPSPRVRRLQAREEKLQLSPSTLAQIKERSPGTPSSLSRSVFAQNPQEKRARAVTSPISPVKDHHLEPPSSLVEFHQTEEEEGEEEEEEEEEVPNSGFSLQEFLQEDKRKENDELIDTLIAKVLEPISITPSSPKKSLRSRRPRVGKLGLRLLSATHSKQTKSERSEPLALAREVPEKADRDIGVINRVRDPAPDIRFSIDDIFNDDSKQSYTVGALNSPDENGLSVFEFLEVENRRHGRPDSPTLPLQDRSALIKHHVNSTGTRSELQDEDDVFKISPRNFSSRREQKNDGFQFRPPSQFFQKYDIDILPELPAQLSNRHEFLTSTVAALRSVSSPDTPTRPKSALVPKSPHRHKGTPLALQRAASVASNATRSVSDSAPSPTLGLEEMKRHSATTLAESSWRLSIPSITDKRFSMASISTSTTGSLSLTRNLTVKKLRSWKDFSIPGTPLNPKPPTPRIPQPLVTDQLSKELKLGKELKLNKELKESIRKRVAEAKAAVIPKLRQQESDYINLSTARKDEKATKLTVEEERCKWENDLATFSEWKEWVTLKDEEEQRRQDIALDVIPASQKLGITPSRPTSSSPENARNTSFTFKALKASRVDTLCPLPTEADFKSNTPRSSQPETPMSPYFPPRTPSISAFPPLSAAPTANSFRRPSTGASYSFISRLSSRRPSAANPVNASNPFGPLVYWIRPEIPTKTPKQQTKQEDVEESEQDSEQEGESEGMKVDNRLLRYYEHDRVQAGLRRAYQRREKTQNATDVARDYLSSLNEKYITELEEFDFTEAFGRETGQFFDRVVNKEHFRLAWAVRFLERCEQNGW